ncbi:predicted protein [Nematostella vectensis]|uniref:Apple domain-containing protein n=1 Tax=Nematostella vectensis TaxID=45351 RepID=A7RRU0_NEMVE|nr:predicted protein [Nematostella vectensis]|eukprot:XP_001637884.1 predicted protein [Nematostella vectensis]
MAIPGLFLLISFNWGLSLSQHCEAELSEYGMALKGSAYRSGFSVNLGECGNKCQDDPKCLSITYERDSRICHLNNATKAMLPSVDGASMERQGMSVYATVRLPGTLIMVSLFAVLILVSIYRHLILGQHCEAELSEYGMALKGSAYRSGFSVNLGECGNKCQDDPKCLSITYERDSRICHLNNATKAMLPSVDGASMERQGMSVYATVRFSVPNSYGWGQKVSTVKKVTFPQLNLPPLKEVTFPQLNLPEGYFMRNCFFNTLNIFRPTECVKTTDGKCCALPFVYQGVTYTSCTSLNHNRPWCALTAVYDGTWRDCA